MEQYFSKSFELRSAGQADSENLGLLARGIPGPKP